VFFKNSSSEPFFTIADLFGYVITFLVIWFIWTTYKAASNVASHAKSSAIAKVSPVVENIKQEATSLKEISKAKTLEVKESSFLDSMLSSTKSFFGTITNSPDEALHSLNESINQILGSSSDDTEIRRTSKEEQPNPRRRGRMNDSLAPL
jgi:hypothetical protein